MALIMSNDIFYNYIKPCCNSPRLARENGGKPALSIVCEETRRKKNPKYIGGKPGNLQRKFLSQKQLNIIIFHKYLKLFAIFNQLITNISQKNHVCDIY